MITVSSVRVPLGCLAIFTAPAIQAQNLILNGDFESYNIRTEAPGNTTGVIGFGGNTVPFWNSALASGSLFDDRYINNGVVPGVYAGEQSFLMSAGRPLEQSVNLVAGTQYRLSFANSAQVGELAYVSSFNLSVSIGDGVQTVEETFTRVPPADWQESAILFIAENTGSYTLTFFAPAGGSNVVYLDNISLVAVPEPSSVAALAGAFALSACATRRRRRAHSA